MPGGPDFVLPLPTGFTCLDKALGIGGLPRGRITEIFGPASCGKSALALAMVAYLQSQGGAAAWVDADHSFDPAFAADLGVDVRRMPVVEPGTTEQACEMVLRLADSRVLDLVVIDSAAALVPQLEIETGIGTSGGALQSRALASALRRLAPSAARSGVSILVLNQTRIRAGYGPGELETSAGGPPLKLYAAVRIALAAHGRIVSFRVVKNSVAAAFGTGELEWYAPREGVERKIGFVERP